MRMDIYPQQREAPEGTFEEVDVDLRTLNLPSWFNTKVFFATGKEAKRKEGQPANVQNLYLSVGFRIQSGAAKGHGAFCSFTLKNTSAEAMRIGHAQLGELMWACGLPKGADSQQLLNKELQVKFGLEKSREFGDKLRFIAAKPVAGGATAPTADPAPQAMASNPAAQDAPKDDFDDDIPF